jgi:two-component system nitrogen regulation sensor histidine kinase GlnL
MPTITHQYSAIFDNMNRTDIDSATLIENINTAVLVFDDKLRLQTINAAGENLLSVSSNKVIGLRPEDFLPGASQFFDNLKRTLVECRPYIEWGVELNLQNQRTITVGCMVTPLLEGDRCRQIIVELIDSASFTRVMREESITAVYDTARKSLKGIAHEIKNPLGGLRGAAQLLERELGDNELKEYTQIIIKEADRLRNLVDRMLVHDTRPQLTEVNLHELLEYVVDLVQAETASRLDISRDYDPSLPLLQADKEQLLQVFINVIRNAMQAIATNGRIWLRTRIKRRCTIRQQFHRLVAQIDIIDDGPGIPLDIESEVFYPLITGRAEGTGLGLSIAQSLLQLHGGSISYEREHDRTVFRILLPLGQKNE